MNITFTFSIIINIIFYEDNEEKIALNQTIKKFNDGTLAQWRMSPNDPFYPTFILISLSKKCKKKFSFQDIIIHNPVFYVKRKLYIALYFTFFILWMKHIRYNQSHFRSWGFSCCTSYESEIENIICQSLYDRFTLSLSFLDSLFLYYKEYRVTALT